MDNVKYLKYVSFPWPQMVAARYCKRTARAPYSTGSHWLYTNYPYTQNSRMCDSPCSFNSVAVAITKVITRESDGLITSNTVYRRFL